MSSNFAFETDAVIRRIVSYDFCVAIEGDRPPSID